MARNATGAKHMALENFLLSIAAQCRIDVGQICKTKFQSRNDVQQIWRTKSEDSVPKQHIIDDNNITQKSPF